MIKKIMRYFNYIQSFVKSNNRRKLVSELKKSIAIYGLKLGIQWFLHKKNLQILEYKHEKIIESIGYKIIILTTKHYFSLANLIKTNLERLNKTIEIIFDKPETGYLKNLHYVICPQFFSELPEFYIAFQTEQSVNSSWFTINYLKKLKNSFAVLDYSLINIECLLKNGLSLQQIYYLPINGNLCQQKHISNEVESESLFNEFNYYFYRFMLANDLISYPTFYNLVGNDIRVSGNFWCLSLSESWVRQRGFIKDNKYGISIFNGVKHRIGWVGCALSFKTMINKARDLNFSYLIVCEDDVEFPPNFSTRLKLVLEYLTTTKKKWDIFSGLIADLNPQVKVLAVDQYHGEEFVYIDKMVSTVFNIYNNSIFETILNWNEHNRDFETNTIDRYLEAQENLKTVTLSPFLVGHKDEHDSTLWNIKNIQYSEAITNSMSLLNQKIRQYGLDE
jgi:hypothetical protein